jgi:nucleotide-binding universal stress UspA family protein
VRGRGIEVHSVVQSGTICDCILQAVSDHRVDLLVLGTRARTKAGAVALGTVARQLLAKAPCSILTVPSSEDEASRSTRGWRQVLAATDFSAASRSALRLAQSIVKGRLVVLHAARCGNEQKCSHCLERLRLLAPSHEPHRVPVEHIVISGEAGEVIAGCARKLHVDLVVLGSPEKELTADDFQSSTVLRVVSSVSCPVLCVPSTKQSAAHDVIHEVSFAC